MIAKWLSLIIATDPDENNKQYQAVCLPGISRSAPGIRGVPVVCDIRAPPTGLDGFRLADQLRGWRVQKERHVRKHVVFYSGPYRAAAFRADF